MKSLRKNLLFSLVFGAVVSGTGLVFVQIGGWGPCGPAGAVAKVGGCLNMYQVIWVFRALPWMDEALIQTNSVPLNAIVIWAIPTLFWAIPCFCVLTAAMKWKQRSQRIRGETESRDMCP